ncbi:hypothetical protein Ndes2526B_g07777 [Nannochloris sp. 'desiccata']
MEENSGSRPRLGSRLSLSSRLEKLSQESILSQDVHPNSAPSQTLAKGGSLPTSAGTHPLRRAPLLARPPKNATPASADDNEDDGFDLLDGLLDDANEEEEENNEKQQPPLTATNPLAPLQKPNINNKSIVTTLPKPGTISITTASSGGAGGLQKKVNPFSRRTPIVNSSGNRAAGGASAPRHVTLARQAPPTSINVDSSAMLQSVLGPAMAFKKPAVVAPAAAMRKEPPAQSKNNFTKGSGSGGGLRKKETCRELIDDQDEDDDDDDFVKPAPKRPLISRQVPLIKKPPGPLLNPKEKERAASQAQQVPSQPAVVLEKQPLLHINIASTSSAAAAAAAGGGGDGTTVASHRFQAPRMTQPPPPYQQQEQQQERESRLSPPQQQQQQQQQLQPQRPPLWTADIIDLSKDDTASEYYAPIAALPLPESPSAAVWLPDPHRDQQQQQQQHQQQQIYRQPGIVANDPQPQLQIWRAPQDNNVDYSAGEGTGGLFGPAAPAIGGIFAQPPQQQQQQQALGGIFAAEPVQQQYQHHRDDEWSIPAVHNHNDNSSHQQQQQQQREQYQPALLSGGAAARSTEGRSWWYRLPDLVPVSVLQHGHNPRDGTIVHIDYKNQFSGKSGGGATAAAKKAARAEGVASKSRGTKTVNTSSNRNNAEGSDNSAKGYWLTVSGVKTYIDSKGKEWTGRAAWTASKKESGKATEESFGGGRKSTKKAAGGTRKRDTKKGRR